jgi:hypothetical protein
MKIISTLLLLGALLTGAYAQRPRSADPQPSTAPPAVKPAPKNRQCKNMRAECLATRRRCKAR